MSIHSEVCECSIKKRTSGKHLQTRKHGIACCDVVVEEVEKKQCCQCREHKGLEMFRGNNATCSGCLAGREEWARNNTERVKAMAKLSCGK